MQVLKFGGSSVGSAEAINKVIAIVKERSKKEPTIVVVSAMSGMTDQLLMLAQSASQGNEAYKTIIQHIEQKHLDAVRALLPIQQQSGTLSLVKQLLNELESNCEGLFMLRELSMRMQDKPELRDTLNKIEETSKSLYQHSRDFIWSIDSKSDDLREIFSYLRDFGEDFFHSLPVDFLVSSKDFSEQKKVILPMYSGRHIILIFKEAITNAAKHSQCKNITLSLDVSESTFKIILLDDGNGIIEGSKKGKGLSSIQERAKNIGCTLQINSNSKGTEIVLEGKLPNSGSAQ